MMHVFAPVSNPALDTTFERQCAGCLNEETGCVKGTKRYSVSSTVEMKNKPTLATRNYTIFYVLLARITYFAFDYVRDTSVR